MKIVKLLPPGVKSTKDFLAKCISCAQCQAVCPFSCIEMQASGVFDLARPQIVPEKAPCFLCMHCARSCPTDALENIAAEDARMGKASITKACLNHQEKQETMCWTCYEKCPLKGSAIELKYGYLPEIQDSCVGCGVCLYVCPVKAIDLIGL